MKWLTVFSEWIDRPSDGGGRGRFELTPCFTQDFRRTVCQVRNRHKCKVQPVERWEELGEALRYCWEGQPRGAEPPPMRGVRFTLFAVYSRACFCGVRFYLAGYLLRVVSVHVVRKNIQVTCALRFKAATASDSREHAAIAWCRSVPLTTYGTPCDSAPASHT